MEKINYSRVRIIGGKWRGRKIIFPSLNELRPTHDRIRETLFNWLSSYIVGARCLDLFAGSGALGFEALSRGAQEVVFVDKSSEAIVAIKENIDRLRVQNAHAICADLRQIKNLPSQSLPYDIVFLDPPYFKGYIAHAFSWLQQQNCLKGNSLVYVEVEKSLDLSILSAWKLYRYKETKTIAYCLFQCKD